MGNIKGGKQLGKDKKRITLDVSAEMHGQILETAEKKGVYPCDIVRFALAEYLPKENAKPKIEIGEG